MNDNVCDEPNHQYHSDHTHLSNSMLKKLRKSPRIFESHYVTGDVVEGPKKCFDIGDAVHAAALEPDRYRQEFAIGPEGNEDKRLKAWKDWSKQFSSDVVLLKHSEHMMIQRCVESLRKIPVIAMLLDAEGVIEKSHRWVCPETGQDCKFRPDKLFPDQKYVLDLKTIAELDDRKFGYNCRDFGYDIQDAHYRDGAAGVYGGNSEGWVMLFAVVETGDYNRSRAYQISPGDLREAESERLVLIADYQRRMQAQDWSEFAENEIQEVFLPKKR